MSMLSVQALSDADVAEAAALHRQVLDMEFLTRLGPGFMRLYYRAWLHSPGAITLVVRDEDGSLLGVLLGASDPALHVRVMVRGHGIRLALAIAGQALIHPRLARDLVVTRGRRYLRGLFRLVRARLGASIGPTVPRTDPTGEITHVLVRPDAQGRGVGRRLIDEAVSVARRAGVVELTLVTPPDMEARHFYERLGWRAEGAMRSQSGEEFLRFRLRID